MKSQAELHAQPRDLEKIAEGEEVLCDGREEEDLGHERQQHDPFAVWKPPLPPALDHAGSATAAFLRSALAMPEREVI